jgi:hypothetical protein
MYVKPLLLLTYIFILVTIALPAAAHKPQVIDSNITCVSNPTISKVYYGTLSGEPHVYTIDATELFELYVGILMPYFADATKDVRAVVRLGDEVVATVGGEGTEWKMMFEYFGQSNYWNGGDFKQSVAAGGIHCYCL